MAESRSPFPYNLVEGNTRVFLAVAVVGWLIVLTATLVSAFALAPAQATFFSDAKAVREAAPTGSAFVQANAAAHTLETWVPQFKFFGLGLGLVAITMALGTIIRRLRGLGQAVLGQLPREMQPPARPLPRSVRIYQSLVIVGILVLLGALIYGAVLAATDVPFVFSRPVAEIDAAQPGSALLSAFGFVNSFAFWLDPLRLVGMAFLPIIRWPGGCFADDYHWRDGVGPRESRPVRVNTWWGRSDEPNQFGTHEFIRLCRLVGAQPYIAGNLGSGSPQEMRDWVEYCNHDGRSTLAQKRAADGSPEPFGVRYWGVGNEPWGCGGHFAPEDYALEYKRFANYLRDFGGTPLYLVAAGPGNDQPAWTRRFFIALAGQCRPQGYCRMHGCAVLYYCGHAGTDVGFSDNQWYELLHRSLLVEQHIVQQRPLWMSLTHGAR